MHVLYHPDEHTTDGLPDLRSRYYHLYCPMPSLPHRFSWDDEFRCHWLDGPFTHMNPITGWAVLASEIPFPCCGRYSSEYVEGHAMPLPIDPAIRKLTPLADPDPRVHLPALLRGLRDRGVSYATLRTTLAMIYEIDGKPLDVDVDALLQRAGVGR
jgi:hypothetical protein